MSLVTITQLAAASGVIRSTLVDRVKRAGIVPVLQDSTTKYYDRNQLSPLCTVSPAAAVPARATRREIEEASKLDILAMSRLFLSGKLG